MGGEGRSRGSRQLTSRKGPERMGNSSPWTRDRLSSKCIFFLYFLSLIRMHGS
jgi:hypothetical protein